MEPGLGLRILSADKENGMTQDDKAPRVKSDEQRRREWQKQDDEVAAETRTVKPKSDAPSRAGITGAGSGADAERG